MNFSSLNLLRLHLAQAELALHKASNNAYSDTRKSEYQQELQKVFTKIEQALVTTTPTDADIYNHFQRHLDFIFKSLEFLDSSTLNQIPYEIVECLNFAMSDWVDSTDAYIIVTSLVNSVNGFGFDPGDATDALYEDLKQWWDADFPNKLVQITLPRNLVRDYFAAVTLYHELGHFVDTKYEITSGIAHTIANALKEDKLSQTNLKVLYKYFPAFKKPDVAEHILKRKGRPFEYFHSHVAEYFCDIFAAQYVGQSSNLYLTYLTTAHSADIMSSHPSTACRVALVDEFLKGKNNFLIQEIDNALGKILHKKLEIRYEKVSSIDFLALLPAQIQNSKQLHGLFEMAWNIWLHEEKALIKILQDKNRLKHYKVLNNLVEKSIGNFITIQKWQKVQKMKRNLGI